MTDLLITLASIVLGVAILTVGVWLLGVAAWGADELLDEDRDQ